MVINPISCIARIRETQYNSGFPWLLSVAEVKIRNINPQGGRFEKPKYGHGLQMKTAESQKEEFVVQRYL